MEMMNAFAVQVIDGVRFSIMSDVEYLVCFAFGPLKGSCLLRIAYKDVFPNGIDLRNESCPFSSCPFFPEPGLY